MKKQRLDQLVFDLGLTESRERAKTTIMSGVVYVNGQKVDKPGTQVDPAAQIEVRGGVLPYVSRGGFKLEKALQVFPVRVHWRIYGCAFAKRRGAGVRRGCWIRAVGVEFAQ